MQLKEGFKARFRYCPSRVEQAYIEEDFILKKWSDGQYILEGLVSGEAMKFYRTDWKDFTEFEEIVAEHTVTNESEYLIIRAGEWRCYIWREAGSVAFDMAHCEWTQDTHPKYPEVVKGADGLLKPYWQNHYS